VDTDLEKFFDRVNHDMLMARVARKVIDFPIKSPNLNTYDEVIGE